jgi:hypothetical protein
MTKNMASVYLMSAFEQRYVILSTCRFANVLKRPITLGGILLHSSGKSIFPARFASQWVLNKDLTVWLIGARPPQNKCLTMSSATS